MSISSKKRSPNLSPGKSEIEVRPFYEAADLAEFMTPEELRRPVKGNAGSSASSDIVPLVSPCGLGRDLGPYVLQAALAACHARARRAADTDWPRIAALYDRYRDGGGRAGGRSEGVDRQ